MYVLCSTVYNSKDLESTQMPIDNRLDWKNVAHIHHGILYSHKKNEFMTFGGTWMKMEIIILSKLTQEQKTKNRMFSLISGVGQGEHMDTGRETSHTGVWWGLGG